MGESSFLIWIMIPLNISQYFQSIEREKNLLWPHNRFKYSLFFSRQHLFAANNEKKTKHEYIRFRRNFRKHFLEKKKKIKHDLVSLATGTWYTHIHLLNWLLFNSLDCILSQPSQQKSEKFLFCFSILNLISSQHIHRCIVRHNREKTET